MRGGTKTRLPEPLFAQLGNSQEEVRHPGVGVKLNGALKIEGTAWP